MPPLASKVLLFLTLAVSLSAQVTTTGFSNTARTEELSNMDQLRQKIQFAHELSDKVGRTAPLTICMAAFGSRSLKPDAQADTARLIDEYAALADTGVSWTTVSVPSPSRAAFIENVQWFGEEVASRVRGQGAGNGKSA